MCCKKNRRSTRGPPFVSSTAFRAPPQYPQAHDNLTVGIVDVVDSINGLSLHNTRRSLEKDEKVPMNSHPEFPEQPPTYERAIKPETAQPFPSTPAFPYQTSQPAVNTAPIDNLVARALEAYNHSLATTSTGQPQNRCGRKKVARNFVRDYVDTEYNRRTAMNYGERKQFKKEMKAVKHAVLQMV